MLRNLIFGACIVPVLASAVFAAGPIRISSPISVHPEPAPRDVHPSATRLMLNDIGEALCSEDASVDLSREGIMVLIEEFPLDNDRVVTLELETLNSRTNGAQLVGSSYDRFGGIVNHDLPWTKVVMFKGTVLGDSDSQVFLGFGGGLVNGWVEVDGTRFMIGTKPNDGLTLIYDMQNVPNGIVDLSPICDTKTPEAIPALPAGGNRDGVDGYAPCNQLWMAIETDNEFLSQFDSSPEGAVPAATAYAQLLVGAVSSILYEPFLDIELVINYLRFWVDEDGVPIPDPWTTINTDGALEAFSLYWEVNMTEVERGLAQLWSGRGLGGGLAKLNSICSQTGNAVMDISGSFQGHYESQDQRNGDFNIFAHETGHNFGMVHTFDMDNPPDRCGEDCSDYDPENDSTFRCEDYTSTIMSYCAQCPTGDFCQENPDWCFYCWPWMGQGNIRWEFAYENIARAFNHLDNLSCDLWHEDPGPPTVIDDVAETEMSKPVDIEVLANDFSNDCTSELTIIRFDRRSVRRGTVTSSSPSAFTYTPRSGVWGTDSFTYTVMSERFDQAITGNVVINIARPDDGPGTGPADTDDVIFIIGVWGTAAADWNGDGTTDIEDLLAALSGKFKPDRTSGK